MKGKLGFVFLAASVTFAQSSPQTPQKLERSLPAFFIPNLGQASASIRYIVDTPGLSAGFTPTAAMFQIDRFKLSVRFVGANPETTIEGEDRLGGTANFLLGNQPQNWKIDLPVYQKILYRNLYPGVDMTYGGVDHRIKSEFLVAPGADSKQIRLEYSGAERLSIEPDGDLLIHFENAGEFAEAREEAPFIYQETAAGDREQVPGRYVLLDAHTLGFEIAAHDLSRPLVIDPVLSYATYLGGSSTGAITALALDTSGNLYLTGWTQATDFQIAGPIQASNGGGVDAFVAKLNAAGTGLLYATYIGGHSDDRGYGIAVDGSGQAYVTGSTASANFPLASPISSTLKGGKDAFVLKINSSGNLLVYSTYLGGTNTDLGYAIAVDTSGNAYVASDTYSADSPVLGGAQITFGGAQDAFAAKFGPSGAMVYSTYLGGSGVEHTAGIALDSSNNAYIAGGTTSTNFPVVGALQAASGGLEDAFLTKLGATGAHFIYSTYLGGCGGGPGYPEVANAVAVDASGNAYIAGATNSPNFPVTTGAYQTQFNALEDAFVAEVNPGGTALVYGTLLGGGTFSWAGGIALGAGGIAYVAGYTSCVGTFPWSRRCRALSAACTTPSIGLQRRRRRAHFFHLFRRQRFG